jgi:hypothetical protein
MGTYLPVIVITVICNTRRDVTRAPVIYYNGYLVTSRLVDNPTQCLSYKGLSVFNMYTQESGKNIVLNQC